MTWGDRRLVVICSGLVAIMAVTTVVLLTGHTNAAWFVSNCATLAWMLGWAVYALIDAGRVR